MAEKASRMRRLSMFPVSGASRRLVSTANTPTAVTVCPAMPSETARSRAMGVSRLMGMNSAEIRAITPMNKEKTADQRGLPV